MRDLAVAVDERDAPGISPASMYRSSTAVTRSSRSADIPAPSGPTAATATTLPTASDTAMNVFDRIVSVLSCHRAVDGEPSPAAV
jgi:hypothetical protein